MERRNGEFKTSKEIFPFGIALWLRQGKYLQNGGEGRELSIKVTGPCCAPKPCLEIEYQLGSPRKCPLLYFRIPL